MTIHDEFLEILRVLAEDPQPSARKPPCPEVAHEGGASDVSRNRGVDKAREGIGS